MLEVIGAIAGFALVALVAVLWVTAGAETALFVLALPVVVIACGYAGSRAGRRDRTDRQ